MSADNSAQDYGETLSMIKVGSQIDHYVIEKSIGRGGMGDVYLAREKKLDKQVALKFLSVNLCQDESYRARFVREAKSLAQVNHPNVVQIYELSEFNNRPFYSMEFVDGLALNDFIAQKQPDLRKLFDIALQVTEGICEVHDCQIVHRDIKPSNILIDKKGRAKLSDFGLALNASEKRLTLSKTVLGTFGYMSPEQVEGKVADARSDIFSWGVTLYEMFTGRQPFIKSSDAATLNAILNDRPEGISKLTKEAPINLQLVLDRAMSKLPEQRYQKTQELLKELKSLGAEFFSSEEGWFKRRLDLISLWINRYRIATTSILSLLLVVTAITFVYEYIKKGTTKSVVTAQKRLTFFNNAFWGATSPNGQYLAYSLPQVNDRISVWVREVEAEDAIEIFEADIVFDLNWSPDSRELLFAGQKDTLSGIFLIPALGGQYRLFPAHLAAVPSVSWSPDGSRFAVNGSLDSPKNLTIIEKKSGQSEILPLEGKFESVNSIQWSPAGDRILFTSYSPNSLWTSEVNGKNPVLLAEGILVPPCWNSKGDAVYFLQWVGDNHNLMKLRIDPRTGQPKANPEILVSGIRCSGAAEISTTFDGKKLTCTMENRWSDLLVIKLDHKDIRSNERTKLSELATRHSWPAFSPDGKWLAYQALLTKGDGHLFIVDANGTNRRRLTFDNLMNFSPAWSPDGKKLAFGTGYKRGDDYKVALMDLESGTTKIFENSLISEDGLKVIWAPGEKIVYQKRGNHNLGLIDPETGAETVLFRDDGKFLINNVEYSSDGTRFAGILDPSRALANDDPADSSGLWIVSTTGKLMKYLGKQKGAPIGWSINDQWIYLFNESERIIRRISALSMKSDTVATIQSEQLTSRASLTRDGKKFACIEWKTITDIWALEDFDPAIK